MNIKSSNGDLIIYTNRKKELGLALFGLLMTYVSLFLAFSEYDVFGKYISFLISIIGVICSLFCALCTIYIIYRCLSKKPLLIVNEKGIVDNSSALGAGLIEWNEIKDIEIRRLMGQEFIGIIPYDLEKVLSRSSKLKRFFIKVNKKMGYAPISIGKSNIYMDLEELKGIILGNLNRAQ